jgi:hypothetical protein
MEDVEDIQTRGTLTDMGRRQRCQLFLSPKYQTASSKCQKNARKIQNFWVIFKAQFFTFKYVF